MGGSVGKLLGGGQKTVGQKTGGRTTSSSEPWRAVQPYLKDLFAKGQTAQEQMSQAQMPNQLSAGFTDAQKLAQKNALSMADTLGGEVQNSTRALNAGLDAANLENNPYFAKAIQAAINPVVQNFERSVIPGQELNAIMNSGYSSSRHGIAEGIARSDLNRQLLDTTAKMSSDAYNQGQDTSMRALALSPQIYQNMLLPSAVQENVGAQQQAMEQQFLTDALTKWNFDRSKNMDSLQQYANLLQGNFGGTSETNSTQKSTQKSDGGSSLGQLIGLATSIAGLF